MRHLYASPHARPDPHTHPPTTTPGQAMAQEAKDKAASLDAGLGGAAATSFKFNVHAPEFVPRSPAAAAASPMASPMGGGGGAGGYYSPFLPLSPAAGVGGPDWSFFAEQEPIFFMPDFAHAKALAAAAGNGSPKGTNADVAQKVVKQVEYQFSDTNLVANDFLMKIMSRDPEGYVPMSVIASWKKIKSLGATNHILVKALRTSAKLIVSDDGKKVRRKQLFTEKHKEELQSRMIIAENLPEDSTRNSLEKIFSVVGSVKNIRICHPQEPSSARSSKGDALVSNKLHALVEYETSQQADKAVEMLNDERNWRKGLRVRTVLRRSPKSVIRSKRPDFDHFMSSDDDRSPHSQISSDSPTAELLPEHHMEEFQNGSKKGWGRGRGKAHPATTPQSPQSAHAGVGGGHFEALSPRQAPQGPRMPDGTRGFTMGRGKPAAMAPPPPLRAVTAPASLLM